MDSLSLVQRCLGVINIIKKRSSFLPLLCKHHERCWKFRIFTPFKDLLLHTTVHKHRRTQYHNRGEAKYYVPRTCLIISRRITGSQNNSFTKGSRKYYVYLLNLTTLSGCVSAKLYWVEWPDHVHVCFVCMRVWVRAIHVQSLTMWREMREIYG